MALGIGDSVDATELAGIVSAPTNSNVIRVQDFSGLPTAEDQLTISSCTRKWNLPIFTDTCSLFV